MIAGRPQDASRLLESPQVHQPGRQEQMRAESAARPAAGRRHADGLGRQFQRLGQPALVPRDYGPGHQSHDHHVRPFLLRGRQDGLRQAARPLVVAHPVRPSSRAILASARSSARQLRLGQHPRGLGHAPRWPARSSTARTTARTAAWRWRRPAAASPAPSRPARSPPPSRPAAVSASAAASERCDQFRISRRSQLEGAGREIGGNGG